MSTDRDPLELLPGFIDPEPDPVVMHAVIAQSREAFANRHGRARAVDGFSLSRWLRRSTAWVIAAGALAASIAAVIVVAPNFSRTATEGHDMVADVSQEPQPSAPTLSRGRDPVTETVPQDGGTRMGAQPTPWAMPTAGAPSPQVVSSFQGDGIVIGTRLDATALEIYLPEISGEQTIDVQSVMPGETVEILSAFATPDGALIAVQFRVNDVRFWRLYSKLDGTFARDTERSKLVSDAPDKAEVNRRLAAP